MKKIVFLWYSKVYKCLLTTENRLIRWKANRRLLPKAIFLGAVSCIFITVFFIFSYGREKYSYDVSGKRNPFIPLITADGRLLNLDIVASPEALSLQGIMYDANDISYAIVNNVIVKAGDMVAGSQVLKIEEDKVSFVKDGQVSVIELDSVKSSMKNTNKKGLRV